MWIDPNAVLYLPGDHNLEKNVLLHCSFWASSISLREKEISLNSMSIKSNGARAVPCQPRHPSLPPLDFRPLRWVKPLLVMLLPGFVSYLLVDDPQPQQ